MAHKHPVTDSDVRFIINPYTRALRDTTPEAKTIMRGDHNAEIFTVEMPRFIEGHDMTKCDIAQVWFKNGENEGFLPITDLQTSLEDSETLVFSWKVHRLATQYVGALTFMFYFGCTDPANSDEMSYEWHTNPFSRISVKDHFMDKETIDALQEQIDAYIEAYGYNIPVDDIPKAEEAVF